MSILRRFDLWAGKTLFHPPIILACQLTRQTQYAMHRALWFFSACVATATIGEDGWVMVCMMWGWTLFNFINAAWQPDRPAYSLGAFRFIIWAMLFMAMPAAVLGHMASWRGVAVNLLVLFAEYAATIKTIPPRRKRERRSSAKEAFNGN